jgi:hypothetical protein
MASRIRVVAPTRAWPGESSAGVVKLMSQHLRGEGRKYSPVYNSAHGARPKSARAASPDERAFSTIRGERPPVSE